MVGLFLVVLAASVYLVYVLEILKFKRLNALLMAARGPATAKTRNRSRTA